MNIKLLYFSGCPSWKNTLELLTDFIESHQVQVEIKLIQVETKEEAENHQFYGSPTIKVNGKDLFPVDQGHYHLGCRIYKTPTGFKGSPSKEMIEEKLREYFI
jgi:hypothetical protein